MNGPGEVPTVDDLEILRRDYDVIPLVRSVALEGESAVTVFEALDTGGPAFVLERFEQEGRRGRHSILAFSPRRSLSIAVGAADPLPVLRTELAPLRVLRHPDLPSFCGGAAGYFGYGAARWTEGVPDRHRAENDLPDAQLFWFDDLVVLDHEARQLLIVSNMFAADPRGPAELLEAGAHAVESTITKLKLRRARTVLPHSFSDAKPPHPLMHPGVSAEQFHGMVRRAREEIEAGEVFQVVLSQRWETEFEESRALDLYSALRELNPSPYTFLLRLDGCTIVGASPELLVGLHEGVCETRPIAGTRPRGDGAEEDAALASELLGDAKENAEHLMLLDLGRNDLGRVSDPGSVHVTQFREVERYSHVSHMVSHVEGTLRVDRSALDLLLAAFPAGTVSGAPKIRAMELIDEIEPVRRGIYSGAITWFGYDGSLDSCITLRSAVLQNGKIFVQAGAGIVWNSDPEKEYEETVNKASALFEAIEISRGASS